MFLILLTSIAWSADLLSQGLAAQKAGKNEEAVKLLGQYLQDHPDAAAVRSSLAQEGRFDEGLKDLDRAAALAPKNPWVFHKRGMIKFCMGQNLEAVADLSAAIKLAPDRGLFYFCRGEIYLQHLHQKDKAAADFQKGCRLESPLCCAELEKMGIVPIKK